MATKMTKGVMMAVAGMAVGFFGGRLLRPLIAGAVGSTGVRLGRDPFETLVREHRLISSLLDEMEGTSDASRMQRMRLFLRLKRTLSRHAMAEEDVVYPLVYDQLKDREGSKHLYDDHAEVKIHLFEIERCIKSDQDWSHPVRAMRNLIESHVRLEENEYFPKLRRALDERHTRTLAQGIRREEALVL